MFEAHAVMTHSRSMRALDHVTSGSTERVPQETHNQNGMDRAYLPNLSIWVLTRALLTRRCFPSAMYVTALRAGFVCARGHRMAIGLSTGSEMANRLTRYRPLGCYMSCKHTPMHPAVFLADIMWLKLGQRLAIFS